ncbi:ABC transporter permease [Rubritalea tangerina]|uniref:ABC transporter permease n=1 Tax=Rubritalea tangerina TaxID=430798 RepID=A0ABW4ZDU8_9BACT
MKIHQLILKELKLRKLGASLSILTIVIALTSIIAALHAMRQFDIETQTQLGALTQQTDARVKKMNDQIRKTMKGLGFNVHIYPSQQDLSEVYANGYASNTMPYNYVERLAESPIVTINHLLPQLSRRTLWKEQNREIMLIGVDGQVPISHRDPKKPIMSPVKPGQAVIGSELATQLNLKKGQTITLNDYPYTVSKVHPQRGNIDDITVWVPLADVQAMLNLPDQINSILALGCNCASVDRLGEIRAELSKVIPNTKIIEVESKALARAEARNKVKADSQLAKKQLLETRDAARQSRENFLTLLSPLILLASLIGLFTLSLFNVRERKSEIGTLLSMGVHSSKLFALFLGRACIIGIAGSLITAILIACLSYPLSQYWLYLLIAPALTLTASWLPTLTALSQDPVTILKQD